MNTCRGCSRNGMCSIYEAHCCRTNGYYKYQGMDRAILARVIPLFQNICYPDEYDLGMHLYDNIYMELGLDSLQAVELLMEVEKEFKISITDNEFNTVQTIEDIINLVQKKMAYIDGTPKELYWKDGNILLTRRNGVAIVAGTLAVCEAGAFPKDRVDSDLNQKDNCDSNDILEVYDRPAVTSMSFNVFSISEVRKYCSRLWKRPEEKKEMSISEIERKLGLASGTLRIKK